ncbi:MAG: DEAD/DEAH box helicase [Thermoprotei archaeon]
MIILRSRKWLDDEEFREILRIADYNGYEKGKGSIFVFNLEKALKNGYSYEDILLLIKEYDLEVDQAGLEELKKIYEELGIEISWDRSTGTVLLNIPYSLYSRIRDTIKQYGARFVEKKDKGLIFRINPNIAFELVDKIKSTGFRVVDKIGILKNKPLPVKIELKNITLREYQHEALEKWISNNYRGIIALPTGSGKTVIGIAAIAELGVRTLIITYTKEQMFQWRDSIIRFTTIEPSLIGLMYSEEKRLAPITITTYHSGFRNINEISPYFTLLIIDEVHHLPADKFKYIALHSVARYRMGLSATPIREDGKHEELFPLLGGIIYYRSASELANMGYLAKYRVYTIKVRLTREEEREFEKLRRKYRKLIGYSSFQEVLEAAKQGNEKAKEALRIHSQMRMLLARSESKIEKTVEIAKKELEKGSKIIIFTQYVDQAKAISKKLDALLLTGETPTDERKAILRKFREADKGVLVVTTVGDEGLDIPDANVGIIVSGTGSRRQFIQRLGRLLRPKPGNTEAKLYEIVLVRTPEEYQSLKRKRIDLDEFLTH